MPAERLHHISKKRRFTFLIVPDDDAGKSRKFHLTPWQIGTWIGLFVTVVVAAVMLLLFYTPVGTLIPIPNPALERRYGQELLSLNQRMTSMAEQLVELRAYNIKLRKALGEKAIPTDTGIVLAGPSRQIDQKTLAEAQQMSRRRMQFDEPLLKDVPLQTPHPVVVNDAVRISFPAILPVEGYVTRGFSPEERHYGLDIAGKTGTLINAAADGHVVFAGWTSDEGNVIILSHSHGFVTFYKHNQSLLKTAGEFVKRGEPIALLGNSGRTSSGPHLHFEIWKDGTAQDPTAYLLNMNF